MPSSLLPAIALALLVLGPTAASQEVSLLLPADPEVTPGEPLRLHLAEERGGQQTTVAWPADEIEWLFVRAAGTQRNLHDVLPDSPGGDRVTLDGTAPGITVIGLQRRARVVTLEAQELREFLALRVDPSALPDGWRAQLPDGAVRVRRIESAKLLVRVRSDDGDGAPPSSTAQSKTGQAAEIRLLADPTRVPLRHDLPLRVYLPGARPDASLVIARHVDTGRTQRFPTDPGGTGFFTVTGPGTWSAEVHGARPLTDDPDADWELVSATVRFTVPPRDAREGAGR